MRDNAVRSLIISCVNQAPCAWEGPSETAGSEAMTPTMLTLRTPGCGTRKETLTTRTGLLATTPLLAIGIAWVGKTI